MRPRTDQEDRQHGQHAEDGDAADDRQLAALEVAPVAAGRLDQAARPLASGIEIRPVILSPSFSALQKLVFADTASAVGLKDSCAAARRAAMRTAARTRERHSALEG